MARLASLGKCRCDRDHAGLHLLFLPLMPMAVIAIICLGLGLLPLSPLFSLSAACILRADLLWMAASGTDPR